MRPTFSTLRSTPEQWATVAPPRFVSGAPLLLVSPSVIPSAPRKASRDRPPFLALPLPMTGAPQQPDQVWRGPDSSPVGHNLTTQESRAGPDTSPNDPLLRRVLHLAVAERPVLSA